MFTELLKQPIEDFRRDQIFPFIEKTIQAHLDSKIEKRAEQYNECRVFIDTELKKPLSDIDAFKKTFEIFTLSLTGYLRNNPLYDPLAEICQRLPTEATLTLRDRIQALEKQVAELKTTQTTDESAEKIVLEGYLAAENQVLNEENEALNEENMNLRDRIYFLESKLSEYIQDRPPSEPEESEPSFDTYQDYDQNFPVVSFRKNGLQKETTPSTTSEEKTKQHVPKISVAPV